jgi:hypothetical protein
MTATKIVMAPWFRMICDKGKKGAPTKKHGNDKYWTYLEQRLNLHNIQRKGAYFFKLLFVHRLFSQMTWARKQPG